MWNDVFSDMSVFSYLFFGGWVVEVIFHAVALGKVINRGFLNGPVCPVYGFGVLSVFALLNTIQGSGRQMSDGMILCLELFWQLRWNWLQAGCWMCVSTQDGGIIQINPLIFMATFAWSFL